MNGKPSPHTAVKMIIHHFDTTSDRNLKKSLTGNVGFLLRDNVVRTPLVRQRMVITLSTIHHPLSVTSTLSKTCSLAQCLQGMFCGRFVFQDSKGRGVQTH